MRCCIYVGIDCGHSHTFACDECPYYEPEEEQNDVGEIPENGDAEDPIEFGHKRTYPRKWGFQDRNIRSNIPLSGEEIKEKKKMTKKGLKILCGILFLIVAVGVVLAILEYATPYKPSNLFKKVIPEQEQTEEYAGMYEIVMRDGEWRSFGSSETEGNKE